MWTQTIILVRFFLTVRAGFLPRSDFLQIKEAGYNVETNTICRWRGIARNDHNILSRLLHLNNNKNFAGDLRRFLKMLVRLCRSSNTSFHVILSGSLLSYRGGLASKKKRTLCSLTSADYQRYLGALVPMFSPGNYFPVLRRKLTTGNGIISHSIAD